MGRRSRRGSSATSNNMNDMSDHHKSLYNNNHLPGIPLESSFRLVHAQYWLLCE